MSRLGGDGLASHAGESRAGRCAFGGVITPSIALRRALSCKGGGAGGSVAGAMPAGGPMIEPVDQGRGDDGHLVDPQQAGHQEIDDDEDGASDEEDHGIPEAAQPAQRPGEDLSLIHISEPTRPY